MVGESSGADILEIEVDPNALEYLKKKGNVFILTDVQNPKFSYYKIKGYDAKLEIIFMMFVEICRNDSPKTGTVGARAEFTVKTFDVEDPANAASTSLEFYVGRSGFSSMADWLRTLKSDSIPKCSTKHKKIFYLYRINTKKD